MPHEEASYRAPRRKLLTQLVFALQNNKSAGYKPSDPTFGSMQSDCAPKATSANWVGYIYIPEGEDGNYTFKLGKRGGAAKLHLDDESLSSPIIDTTGTSGERTLWHNPQPCAGAPIAFG